MKLRNKKTGRVVNFRHIAFDEPMDDRENYRYASLAEFNEEWEDCEPQEPLIKDEKIRKAVRAWAEANRDISQVTYEKNVQKAFCDFVDLESLARLRFNFIVPLLKCYEVYTITELCGEEE